jgi:hypothetical protein
MLRVHTCYASEQQARNDRSRNILRCTQNPYRTDQAALANTSNRLHQCLGTSEFDNMVHSSPVREPQHLEMPVRVRLVINAMCRAEFFGERQLRIRGGSDDYRGSQGRRDLPC